MWILRQTVANLFDSLPTEPVLRTFIQYSITFRSQPEAANDVIISVAVADIRVK